MSITVAMAQPGLSFVERLTRERDSGSSAPSSMSAKSWTDRIGPRGDKRAPVRVLGA